jgi:hypothetical protein
MPGAGKSTLLAGLEPRPDVVVLDSDAQRAALAGALPGVPYAWLRPLVHLSHRLAVLVAAASDVPVVVVHLPATDARVRAAVARLAATTGRAAHLVWLDVGEADARQGQRERGRIVPEGSFAEHARRATDTASALRAGPEPGWRSAVVLDRATARAGLHLDTGAPVGAPQ